MCHIIYNDVTSVWLSPSILGLMLTTLLTFRSRKWPSGNKRPPLPSELVSPCWSRTRVAGLGDDIDNREGCWFLADAAAAGDYRWRLDVNQHSKRQLVRLQPSLGSQNITSRARIIVVALFRVSNNLESGGLVAVSSRRILQQEG